MKDSFEESPRKEPEGDIHDQPAARKRRAGRQRRTAAGPVTVRKPNALTWAKALELAGGDHKRLTQLPDGSIVVSNRAP